MKLSSSPQQRDALTGKVLKAFKVVGTYMCSYIGVCKCKGLVANRPWGYTLKEFTQHSSEEFIHVFTSTHVHAKRSDAQTYKQRFRHLNLGINSHQRRTPGFHVKSWYLQMRIRASWQIARQLHNVWRWRGNMMGRGVKRKKREKKKQQTSFALSSPLVFLSCLFTVLEVHSGPVTTHIWYQNSLLHHAKRASLHMSFCQRLHPDICCKMSHLFFPIFWRCRLCSRDQEKGVEK